MSAIETAGARPQPPVAPPHATVASPRVHPPVPQSTEAVRPLPLVLLVDDDQNSREGMTEWLVEHGFRVVGAADGLEALDKAEHRQPDLVLLDLAIPRLDGWTVARRLRTESRFRGVPVVAVSAMDYPDEVARAMDAGCCAFVTKPCDLSVLVDTIDTILAAIAVPRPTAGSD
jgi:CheY-like chemotaxis protein